jgi:hypothetical protein
VDLGRKGVVWLEGRAIQIERTGGDRAVARLAGGDLDGPPQEPDTLMTDSGQTVIAAAIGETTGPGPDDLEPGQPSTLLAGGRRRKDSLAAIDRWYRRVARERIEEVVVVESQRLDLAPGKISIRDQKTRWGSCSTSGTLSFNWRLVIGPHEALRYVVIHELVHIEHHNHSRAFWSALTAAIPEWKRPAAWLKANERALTAYRPRL